ncbi:hypothetical protein ABPG72_008656 [Tetrahymena utriculariae]
MENKKIKSRGVASIIVGQYTINNAIKGELCKFWKKHNCLRGKQCRFQHRCVASVTKIKIPKHNTDLVTIMVTQVISLDPEKAAKYVMENQDKAIGIILDDYQLLAPTKEVINDCRKKRADWQDLERILKNNIEQKIESEKLEELIKRKKSPTKLSKNKNQNKRKTYPRWKLNQKKKLKKKNKKIQYQIPFGSHQEKEIKNPNGSITRVSKIDSLILYKKNDKSFTEDSVWDTHSEISNTSSRSLFSHKELTELKEEMQKSIQLNPPKDIDWNTYQPKSQQEMQIEQTNKFNTQIIKLTPIQSEEKKGTKSDKLKQTMITDYKK